MTYNVFSGTLNAAQSIAKSHVSFSEFCLFRDVTVAKHWSITPVHFVTLQQRLVVVFDTPITPAFAINHRRVALRNSIHVNIIRFLTTELIAQDVC